MNSARDISWFYFKAGLIAVLIPVIFIGLLLFVLTLHCKPLPPQPMLHQLNTEEIRDFCGPSWHCNISLTDRTGRRVCFDEDLNLVVMVCLSIAEHDEFDQWPSCNFESAKFSKGSKHDSRCPAAGTRSWSIVRGGSSVRRLSRRVAHLDSWMRAFARIRAIARGWISRTCCTRRVSK